MIEIVDAKTIRAEDILSARGAAQPDVTGAVGEILAAVKTGGDAALLDYTQRFDGVRLTAGTLRVSEEEMADAKQQVGREFLDILSRAAANIRAFHEKQQRQGFIIADTPGVVMGQKITPMERVGLYVPGGTAAYPSTVLMDAIPGKIAGVQRLVMATPPDKEGRVNPAILAAAAVAGITEIYKVGGAQAVAALAYGTETVPKVDKIVGPGNLYVATAKRMVYGMVDIDMIAGPSDILVVADAEADPVAVAADMLAQAEHDENAAAVLVTTDAALATAVHGQLYRQLENLPRAETARASLEKNGRILLADTLAAALDIANALAPEHLELCVAQPFELLPLVKNAGSIFLGRHTPEALGDYWAGPNHTLPTGGAARFSSPLSVDDFIKKSSYLHYSYDALSAAAADVQAFALREGLAAHANSVAVRLRQQEEL